MLPLWVIPVTAVFSSAWKHAVPPDGTTAAVALAVIVGAADMKIELNGNVCCTAKVTVTRFWITPVSAGKATVNPRTSKVLRARAVTPEIESGNVYLPHPSDPGNEWVHDLLSELRNFPHDAHDDQVDAESILPRMQAHAAFVAPEEQLSRDDDWIVAESWRDGDGETATSNGF